MTTLGELTWPEVAEASRGALLAVPVGSTEQHGPHLPLSTDTDVAVALCERLAAACPGVVVAPSVAYGSSGEHAGFPGTLSIGQEALELLLVELGRSACASFPRVLLVSAHGGNAAPVARAVAILRAESRDVRCWSPRWDGDAHAGRIETSLQLALDPARVRAFGGVLGATAPVSDLLPLLRSGRLPEVSPSGVLGDPAGATAAAGAALLAALAGDLARVVGEWAGCASPS